RQPAASPNPMGGNRINHRDKQRPEKEIGAQFGPFGKPAPGDGQGNRGKGQLEQKQDFRRDSPLFGGETEKPPAGSEQRSALSEGDGIPHSPKRDAGQGETEQIGRAHV